MHGDFVFEWEYGKPCIQLYIWWIRGKQDWSKIQKHAQVNNFYDNTAFVCEQTRYQTTMINNHAARKQQKNIHVYMTWLNSPLLVH